MNPLGLFPQPEYADVASVGLPHALLYYRYAALWQTFFAEIGRTTVVSRPTDRDILTRGDALSIDECCLASKAYLGHVDDLIGRCDALFVPSLANVGRRRGFCTKFQALPDLVANTFHGRDVRIASCLVDEVGEKSGMQDAFLSLGARFGVGARDAKHAYKEALRAQTRADHAAAHEQERLLASLAPSHGQSAGRPLAILLVAHPYVAHDPCFGGQIAELLDGMGCVVAFADECDHDEALRASFDFSETLPWLVNRELVGAITLLHDRIDGIVLASAFPCGPDSMTDDAILRCIQGKPILNLTIDAQSGTAGLETRVESFVDILRYQQKGGYVR